GLERGRSRGRGGAGGMAARGAGSRRGGDGARGALPAGAGPLLRGAAARRAAEGQRGRASPAAAAVTTTAPRHPSDAAAPPDEELLARLADMPSWLGRAATGPGDAKLRQAPAGAPAFVEQVWHLADLEREGFAERVRRLYDEEDPFLPDFDGARLVRERAYRTLSFAEGLAAFAAARARNLQALRALPAAAWSRCGRQEGTGPVRPADIPRPMGGAGGPPRAAGEAPVPLPATSLS